MSFSFSNVARRRLSRQGTPSQTRRQLQVSRLPETAASFAYCLPRLVAAANGDYSPCQRRLHLWSIGLSAAVERNAGGERTAPAKSTSHRTRGKRTCQRIT